MTDPAAHDSPSERDVEPSDDLDCFTDGADDSSHLRNLLAIIHGDGGHHTATVGVAQSCRDAEAEFHRLRLLSPQRQAQQPGTATLDLDAVAIRSHVAAKYVGSGDEHAGFAWRSALDVPDLVAEVLRLREELAAQETSTCHLGDLLRATVNALKGDPPPLTTWSTHDLPDVAAEMRRRDEYSVAIIAVGETMKEEYIQRARDLSRFRGQVCYTSGIAKRLLPSLETHGEDGWPLDRVAADALAAEVERLRARVAELERLAAGPSTTETVTMTHDMIATWGRAFG